MDSGFAAARRPGMTAYMIQIHDDVSGCIAPRLDRAGFLSLREPLGLFDHRDHLDLNHCLWLSETADLDRRAGRTGYPEVAHAHVGALGECLVVRDEGVGLNNIGPSRASGLEAGVEVFEGLRAARN